MDRRGNSGEAANRFIRLFLPLFASHPLTRAEDIASGKSMRWAPSRQKPTRTGIGTHSFLECELTSSCPAEIK